MPDGRQESLNLFSMQILNKWTLQRIYLIAKRTHIIKEWIRTLLRKQLFKLIKYNYNSFTLFFKYSNVF